MNRRMISGGNDQEGTRCAIVRQLNDNAGKRRRAVEAIVKKNEKSLRMRSERSYNRNEGQGEGRLEMEDDDGRGEQDTEDEQIDIQF